MIMIVAVVCAMNTSSSEIDIFEQTYPHGCREIRIELPDMPNTHQ